MSTVQEIEAAIRRLSVQEMEQVRELLENMIEDQLEFTEEFKAKIARAQADLAAGKGRRVESGDSSS